MTAPDVTVVTFECSECGDTNITVTHDERRNEWNVVGCESIDCIDAPAFSSIWIAAAKHAIRNYDPSDAELRSAGMIP